MGLVFCMAAFAAAFELMRTRLEALASENGLAVPPAAKTAATFGFPGSETVAVAEPIAPVPAAPGSEPHPSLGSRPFAAEFEEARHAPDIDSVAAIRRMSLIEKIAFFA